MKCIFSRWGEEGREVALRRTILKDLKGKIGGRNDSMMKAFDRDVERSMIR